MAVRTSIASLLLTLTALVASDPSRYRVIGYTTEMAALMRVATLFIGKPGGLSSSECMAAGLCPVASALGELPALLGEGDRGVLVPAGDERALASALVELARNRGRAVDLGRRARRHVLEEHTWERNAHVVLDSLRGRPGELAA